MGQRDENKCIGNNADYINILVSFQLQNALAEVPLRSEWIEEKKTRL